MPLTPSRTRSILEEISHHPVKKLGQNFLIDGNIVKKSLSYATLSPHDTIVEIGPGLGTLTQSLLESGAKVYAIEKDPSLLAYLQRTLVHKFAPHFFLLEGDALESPVAGLDTSTVKNFKIVANLPYAISTPWMELVLRTKLPDCLVLMLQKETADRFMAKSHTKAYGPISIFLQSAYNLISVHTVSKGCFYPVPKIDSTLLYLQKKKQPYLFDTEQKEFIRHWFTQRRKQLNGLVSSSLRGREWLLTCQSSGLCTFARPEEVPITLWQKL